MSTNIFVVKRYFLATGIAIYLIFFLVQCQERIETGTDLSPVSFVLSNPALGHSGSRLSVNPNEQSIPKCSDGIPAYVHIKGKGPEGFFDLVLNVLESFEDGTQTMIVKMAPGDYEIDVFEVLDDKQAILFASPQEGSHYDDLFGFTNNVTLNFSVKAFAKTKVKVDVLCWENYSYREFGYVWQEFNRFKVRTICFYGEVCNGFYNKWHAIADKNPYYGQGYNSHDFPAIITVEIMQEGEVVSVVSNIEWKGEGEPLCIEYLDNVDVAGETFAARLYLHLPDGSKVLLDEIPFNDAIDPESDSGGWGGENGVFDFDIGVAGGCIADREEAFYGLPWMPLPDEVILIFRHSQESYFDLELVEVKPSGHDGFKAGDVLHGWSGDDGAFVYWDFKYLAKVYPYYNIPDGKQFAGISRQTWAMIHWVVNEASKSFSATDIQHAVWKLLEQEADGHDEFIEDTGGPAALAVEHKDYIISPGDDIIVLIDTGDRMHFALVPFDL